MSDFKVAATARVRVVVEVPAASWGSDCNLSQVYKQAGEEAMNKVAVMVQRMPGAKIVGGPEVIAILTDRERE